MATEYAQDDKLEVFKRLGAYLREKRETRSLTQSEVARHLGYGSPQFISNIERGIANVPVKSLKILIHLYQLPTNEVIELLVSEKRASLQKQLGPNEEIPSNVSSNSSAKPPESTL